jgi:hypothetical protein
MLWLYWPLAGGNRTQNFQAPMRAWRLRQWYYFVPKEVVYTLFFCTFHRFEPRVEVTNCQLTQAGMRSRILLVSTHDSRREHTPELIEVHSRCGH